MASSFALETEAATERRTAPRFALLIQAAKIISGDGEFLCVVHDASTEGVRVRHFGHIPSDEQLTFELANGESFPVRRIRQDDEFIGLRFPEGVDLQRLVKLSKGEFPKRPMRVNTQLQGAVIDGAQFHCMVIRNISQHGLCIECREDLALDRLMQVETDTLAPTDVRVRWRIATIYGLVFEQELDCATMAAAIADHPIR